MEFNLTDEQQMLYDMTTDFGRNEVAPIAQEMEKAHRIDPALIDKMAGLELFGVHVPEKFGGSGLGYTEISLVGMALARFDASTSVTFLAHASLLCHPLFRFGSDELCGRYGPKLAKGDLLGTYCLTEPGSGSDAMSIGISGGVKAKRDGDDYILNGEKIFATNGGLHLHNPGRKVLALVYARDMELWGDGKGKKTSDGITAFVVESDAKGFTVSKEEDKLGIVASSTAAITFEDCRVSKANVVGEPGQGGRIALATLEGGRIGIAAQATGIIMSCLDASRKYAAERQQFGQPISSFQRIQDKIVEMWGCAHTARLLVLEAAHKKDKGERVDKEASWAKLYASESAMRCATQAVQLHGGNGYIKDFPVERYFRDAKITEIYEGTSEIQRLVIANNVMREQ
ncbi:MAG: acyl-CoA dehydrogenase family protein [Planctomycetes bacterium]|nr:acyl-CoA dehydrogenase family protein [Planctomycetota bacterium]